MIIHDLSLFRRMLCSLSPHIRTWWGNPPMFPSISVGWSGLGVFLLPSAAQLRTAAEKGQLHVGPDDIQVQLVFYSTSEPMVLPGGRPMKAMGVQKLYEPSPAPILYVGLVADVLGPGARALDAPLPPRQLYSDHPTPAPPAQGRQFSTWAGRCSR